LHARFLANGLAVPRMWAAACCQDFVLPVLARLVAIAPFTQEAVLSLRMGLRPTASLTSVSKQRGVLNHGTFADASYIEGDFTSRLAFLPTPLRRGVEWQNRHFAIFLGVSGLLMTSESTT
jgi:hypothetical protein